MKRIRIPEEKLRIDHYQIPHDRHSYLKGLMVGIFQNPSDDRWSHYASRELFWSGRPKSAIKEFKRHIEMGGWLSERQQSMIFIGDAYGQLNDPQQQVEWYHKAATLDTNRREPLIKLAFFYRHNKNPIAAATYASAALEIPWSDYYANDKAHYEHVPYEILYWAKGWMGDIAAAQQHLLKALAYQPYNPLYLRDTQYYFEYADHGIEGYMRFPELQFLYNLSKSNKTVAEVGSFRGRSTHALLSGGAYITAIDHFQGSRDEKDGTHGQDGIFEDFCRNTKGFTNLTVKKVSGQEASKDDAMYDAVFIDAGHTYEEVKEDIENWLPHATKILCGHDYAPEWPGVRQAVDEAFGSPDEVHDSIWVHYIK